MEKKRTQLGIIFNFRSVWMGGIIYIINIVKALDFLEDDDKPEIYLFYNKNLKKFIDEFDYPYLHLIEWEFPGIVRGNFWSFLRRKNLFVSKILHDYSLDAIYPIHDFPVKHKTETKLISWYADLQHKHYPEYFTSKDLLSRNIRIKNILKNSDHLVVSSQDVLNDFRKFYKLPPHLKVYVYHFVSIIDGIDKISKDELLKKYSLPQEYFIVSNQFHKHKNHRVILKSLAELKEKGIKKHVAFTGKFPNSDGSAYLTELEDIIKDNKLADQVTMLGLISREDQLMLMKLSQAVIQPSLFEGWSTVIEDAKSLQVPVIASNLSVNVEQLGSTGTYFSPHDFEELANILKDYKREDSDKLLYEAYDERVKKQAKVLLEIIKN